MEPLRIHGSLKIPADELSVSFARAGGPGGQNVNKVATKVVLRFNIAESPTLGEIQRARLLERLRSRLTGEGEIVIHASRYRERARNFEDARERLAEMLRKALARPRTRRATRPTRASKERRLTAKKHRGRIKKDRRRGGDD